MRPINRQDHPKDNDGNLITFSSYQNARPYLLSRLGSYCSYCEMRLDASLAVEHVLPKKPEGVTEIIKSRELDWKNFLLACTNCNSTKGDNVLGTNAERGGCVFCCT